MLLTEITLTQHKQLHDVVVDRLRDMIMQGALRPGEWLRQERLARELGVSHTPIREALKQLQVEGLVEHVPYRGVRVVEFSADDVVDLYSMRGALEGIAAAAAAERLTTAQLAAIRACLNAMIAITEPNEHLQELRELNRQFHLLIINGSGRPHLIRTLVQLWSLFPSMLWRENTLAEDAATPARTHTDNREHGAIMDALTRRDSVSAERLMRDHINGSQQALVQYLNAMPKTPSDPANKVDS